MKYTMTATFREETRGRLRLLTWSSPAFPKDMVAAFSTRIGGVSRGPFASLNLGTSVADDPAAVAVNRARLADVTGMAAGHFLTVEQVHGNCITIADVAAATPIATTAGGQQVLLCGRADGLVTSRPGHFLTTLHADCFPIYVADPVARVAVLVHAGWRGTLAGIVTSGVRAALDAGAKPERLWAGIGPGIGPCCYEVGEDVVKRVTDLFGRDGQPLLVPTRPGHARLDLAAANRLLLAAAGIPSEQIATANLCTACHRNLFFSHRRDRGMTGRMMAVLGFGRRG